MANPQTFVDAKPELTPEQKQQIDQQARSYQEEAYLGAFKGGSRGFWTGSLLGPLIGATFGAIAALSTALVPGIMFGSTLGLIGPLAGAFALVGLGLATARLVLTGTVSGAVASSLKEQDTRQIMAQPELAKTLGGPRANLRDFWNNPKGYFTSGSAKLFNGKMALVGIAAGLATGALFLYAAPFALITPAFLASPSIGITGAVAWGAVKAITLTTCALMGGFFGVDFPALSNNVMNFMGELLSGAVFRGPEKSKAPALMKTLSPDTPTASSDLPRSKQVKPVVFGQVTSTQGTPLDSGYHMRRTIAEQQLHALDPNQAMRH